MRISKRKSFLFPGKPYLGITEGHKNGKIEGSIKRSYNSKTDSYSCLQNPTHAANNEGQANSC